MRALRFGSVVMAIGVLACGRTWIGADAECTGPCAIENASGAPATAGYGGVAAGGAGARGGAPSAAGYGAVAAGGMSSGGMSSGGTSSGGTSSGGVAGNAGAPSCVSAPENCVSPQDEDCDGLTPACTGELQFGYVAGNRGAQWPNDLAVNPAGEFALVGAAYGGIDFGPPTSRLGGAWSADPFVVYFESDGTPRWDALFGDTQSQEFVGVAFDPSGDVIATGDSEGVIDFGLGPLSSTGPSTVLTRFTPTGRVEWAKLITGTRSVIGKDVETTARGDIANIGWFSGTVDLGGGPITSDLGYLSNTYVALFDAQGNWIWNQRIGGGDQILAEAVTTDATGAVIVGGWFPHDIDFGNGVIHGVSSTNAFMAKYDPSGTLELSRVFLGTGLGASIASVAADVQGGWFAVGGFDQKLDVGAGTMTGTYAAFVAKFDASGKTLWSKSFDSTGSMSANDVAVDLWGNVLVCGTLNGSTSAPLSISSSSNGAFVIKLDPEGNVVWARSFDGTGEHQAALIGTDGAGNVVVAGHFTGSLQLGAEAFVSTGQSDIYVVKLAP